MFLFVWLTGPLLGVSGTRTHKLTRVCLFHEICTLCTVKWDKIVVERLIPPLTSNHAIVNLFMNLVSGDLRKDYFREPQLEQAVCTDVYTVPMGCELNLYSPPTVFQGDNELKAPCAIDT